MELLGKAGIPVFDYPPEDLEKEMNPLTAEYIVSNSACLTTLERIALALEIQTVPVLLDDKKARRIAEQLNLQVTTPPESMRQDVLPAILYFGRSGKS